MISLFFLTGCREYLSGSYSSTSGLAAMYHGQIASKRPSNPTQMYQQPPRLLIVHIALPSWADICSNLCEALQNFFSLACSLMGPSRIPLFSLYIVQNQHECILPFVVSISILVYFILKAEVRVLEQTSVIITYSNNCPFPIPITHRQHNESLMSSYTQGICTEGKELQNY